MSEAVREVTAATFADQVLQESQRRPVVVDFWAAWCGPCRVLGPTLEKLAAESEGRWVLAKVDVDGNQALAAQFRVQGIPAVKAFRQGKVIDEFTGALPETEVRRWLEGFIPGPAEEAVIEGQAHLTAGRYELARAAFDRALGFKPRHGDALLGLAELLVNEGDHALAERQLDLILPADASRLSQEIAAVKLRLKVGDAGDPEPLRQRLAEEPSDHATRIQLGWALAARARYADALEAWLTVVKAVHRKPPGDEARQAMIDVFEVIGARSELADKYRDELSNALYR